MKFDVTILSWNLTWNFVTESEVVFNFHVHGSDMASVNEMTNQNPSWQ
jgi:hypothetical protein